MITLILPTASRPAMLRMALASVANQTAVDKIGRVYVSENGGCRESEEICKQFPSLPITYVFRTPTTPIEHAKILMRECLHGDFIAYLHDDDWWLPHHLENALKNLQDYPHTAAYGACHFVVAGESSMLNCSGNLFPWFGSNYAPYKPIWELSRLNVLMAELLGTISHYSTLVVRTEIMRKTAYVYDLENPFDNDRMLIFALSQFGSLLYNPVPDAFVRNHPIQDCQTFNHAARIKHMCWTSRWMVENSGKPWPAIASAFSKRMALCPPEAVGTLRELAMKEWCLPEMGRNLPATVAPNQTLPTALPAGADNIAATR